MTLREAAHRLAGVVPSRRPHQNGTGGDEHREAISLTPAQRRENVRVEYLSEVYVGRRGWPLVRCASVDLSASGFSATLRDLALRPGEEVEVYFRMGNGFEIEAKAVVVRSIERGVCAFHFLDIDPSLREALVHQVFAEDRKAISKAKARS